MNSALDNTLFSFSLILFLEENCQTFKGQKDKNSDWKSEFEVVLITSDHLEF